MSDKIDFKSKNFLNALLYILTGLLLCIFRAQVLNVLLTVIGALFIAYGVIFFVTPRVDGWRSQSGDRHCAYFGRLAVCGNCAYHFRNTADVERCERLGNGNSFPHASCNNFCLPDIGNRNIACCKLLGNVGLVFHFAGGNFHRERHFGVVATQTNVVLLTRQRTGNRPFLLRRYCQTHRQDL